MLNIFIYYVVCCVFTVTYYASYNTLSYITFQLFYLLMESLLNQLLNRVKQKQVSGYALVVIECASKISLVRKVISLSLI